MQWSGSRLLLIATLAALPLHASATTNLAQAKPYTSSVAASSSYPDTGGLELTDGIAASGTYTDTEWQGRNSVGTYYQTVDLGQVSQVTQFTCRFLKNTGAAINWPTTVNYAVSTDNVHFTSAGNGSPQTITSSIDAYVLNVSSTTARFVRMTVTGTAWTFEDELQVFGTALPPRILQGTFLQPDGTIDAWAQSNFATEFGYLRGVNMDHMILQWVADSKAMTTIYPTSVPGFTQSNSVDSVARCLAAAKQYGFQVWLGLNYNSDWWTNYADNLTWLQNEFTISNELAQDLWNKYGATYGSVIAGFYLVPEVDNLDFQTTTEQNNMKSVYSSTVSYIHTNTGKLVMTAPFYNSAVGQTASQYASMWVGFLQAAPIDVIAMQDGVGVGDVTVANVGSWFSAFQSAFTTAGLTTQLWSDLETFNSDYTPASTARIISQINAESPYVSKFTSFSFDAYQSPQQGFTSQYNSYLAFVDDLTAPAVTITSPANGAHVTGTVTVSGTATDAVGVTSMQILIDGVQKATSTSGSISYSWNTSGISSGSHTIVINAWDGSGNKGTAQITVTH
jgi:hypothetical protein